MKVMKKDNSTIKASEGLARELALQGYVEVKAADVAAQPEKKAAKK